ncbi:VWD domain-containing protein [Deinococcus sp. KSM4-11]|uniref:VWD domain-containing protein n=1 Tax=Deinococcus sp. KSM4-11 TaxID=2568654 RepID=UPI001454C5B0|nr:VWD domain-containing protein [Deinococcus sp. KSM4-11]
MPNTRMLAGTITTLSLMLALAGCSGGSSTPAPGPLAAPQHVQVIPQDGQATIVWDAPDDAKVTGFNVYQGDQKLNDVPISAQGLKGGGLKVSGLHAQAQAGHLLSYVAQNLQNGTRYDFRVVSVGAGGESSASSGSAGGSPLVCDRYKVDSRIYGSGPYELHRAKLTRAGTGLPGAEIHVLGGGTDHIMTYNAGLSEYFDTASGTTFAWTPGSRADLLTRVGDCLVLATDRVPARPTLSAPAGATSDPTTPVNLTWTLTGSDPAVQNVHLSWVDGGGTIHTHMFPNLPGSARSFSIPAGTLPGGVPVKVWVRTSNPGAATLFGSYTPDSSVSFENTSPLLTLPAGTGAAPQPAVSWGDPHLITLDHTAVEFQAVGEFDLAQSTTDTFRVQARQRPWGGSGVVSVNTAIATRMNGQKAGVYLSGSGAVLRLGNAGTVTPVPAGGLDLGGGYRVTQSGAEFTFESPGGERLIVTGGGGYLNARLTLPVSRHGAIRGLWGNFDGVGTNDVFLRSGTPLSSPIPFADFYGPYATSWRVPSAAESLFVYDSGQSFGGFDDPAFPSAHPIPSADERAAAEATCHAAGVTDPILLAGCVTDVSQTHDAGFASAAANVPAPLGSVTIIPPARADLIVTGFTATLADTCRPYSTFVTGKVTVKNVGSAPSAARSDVGLVQVVDARDEALTGGYRGNGVGLGSVAPGASATVEIPVYYPIGAPEDTTGTRTYFARVNFGHYIDESNTANNRSAGNVDVTIPAGHCHNSVGLIYKGDTSAATAYRDHLKTRGLNVALVDAASLTPSSPRTLAGFDLLAIDPLTGDLNTWTGGADAEAAIAASGKPILGLGGGGYALLGTLHRTLGWGNGAHESSQDSIKASSPLHPALSTPFTVAFTGGLAKVANAGAPVVEYHTSVTGIERVALSPATDQYAPLAVEAKTNSAMWGFYGVPNYTDAGWNAVANLAWYLLP